METGKGNCKSKLSVLWVTLGLLFGLSTTGFAHHRPGHSAGGGGDDSTDEQIPLCVTFVSGFVSDDGIAVYCDSETDVLTETRGGFGFQSYDKNHASPDRLVVLDFPDDAPLEDVAVDLQLYIYPFHNPPHNTGTSDVRAMIAGQSFTTGMRMYFTALDKNGIEQDWHIAFGEAHPRFSQDRIEVTCLEARDPSIPSSGMWTVKTIVTIQTHGNLAMGRLLRLSKTKSWEDMGQYHFPMELAFWAE